MAETSGFFQAVWDESLMNPITEEYTGWWDKAYLAQEFSNYFALFVGNGVFGNPTNQLKVLPGDGMNVIVSPGYAFIKGNWYYNDSNKVISIASNSTIGTRIDSIRVRLNLNSRSIEALGFTGDIDLVRNDVYYDLELAQVSVPLGAVQIIASNITDTRTNENRCGLVKGLMEVETTEDLFSQYQSIFDEWFESVKDQATGDLAVKLQLEFTELNENVTQFKSDVQETVDGYHDSAQEQINAAEDLVEGYVYNDYTTDYMDFVFTNLVCEITDTRVTVDSLIDVYFTSETIDEAEECQIKVDSGVGKITLTAVKQPSSTIRGKYRARITSALPVLPPEYDEYATKSYVISNYANVEQLSSAISTVENEITTNKQALDSEISDIVNVYGSKNLLQYPYHYSSQTNSGITYTVNDDGSVTLNGTSTGVSTFIFNNYSHMSKYPFYGKSGELTLSGCPKGGSATTYDLVIQYSEDGTAATETAAHERGNGITFSFKKFLPMKQNNLFFRVYKAGITFDNITIYPMLRLASIEDDTYAPYVKTNKELTDDKVQNTVIGNIQSTLTANKAYSVGDYFIYNGIEYKITVAIANGGTITIGTNCVAASVQNELSELKYRVGILTPKVPAYVSRCTPPRVKDITTDWESGSLRAEIAEGNFKNIVPGDYIKKGNTMLWVANPDGRYGKGDQTNNTNYPAYGTHHVEFFVKYMGDTSLWLGYGDANKSWRVSANDKGRCPWNAATDVDPTNTEAIGTNSINITRTYNGASVSGYMGSFIRERMDAVILPYLQNLFGSANILKYREINGNAVNVDAVAAGMTTWKGLTSGWGWVDRYMDLPSEIDLFGARVFSGPYDVGTRNERLPVFANMTIQDLVGRIDIWTKGLASSSAVATRYARGNASNSYASNANWACPLVCIK